MILPKYGLASCPSTDCYLIHHVVAQAGTGTRLPQIVHQFLEHEKSWLQFQADLTQFVALLSQQLPTPSHKDVQTLKGK
jgi:hypothetical protein